MQYFKKGLRSIGQMMTTILLNSYVLSAILISPFLLMGSPQIMAAVIVPVHVQTIDTSLFNIPSPDPAGIVYFPSTKLAEEDLETGDFFLVTDSEVNEMAIFQGVNVFKVDRSGELLETFATIRCTDPETGPCIYDANNVIDTSLPVSFSDEPTGITFNPNNNHCFISDDNDPRSIHEVDPGSDGICLTDDDIVTSINVKTGFGIDDPEDVTFGLDSLFIVDGGQELVYRIQRDAEGLFQLHSSFDTDILGMHDPEGIVFDASNESLYIVGRLRGLIIHTTTYGVLLDTLNLNTSTFPNLKDRPLKPAGLALAPTSIYPSRNSLYLVDRGIDNDSNPTENDGKIYELMLPETTAGNIKPTILAGDDQLITLPQNALLEGIVSDDGVPSSSLIYTWSKLSGSGEVSFTDSDKLQTDALFTMGGTYVLRLTAYDGELYHFDDIEVIVESLPVLTLSGANPFKLTIGTVFTDPGATAIDDTDGDLTVKIEVTGTVDTGVAATYILTYTVKDSADNSVSANRNVIVREDAPPVITLLGKNPMQLNLGDLFIDPGVSAIDDIDGDLTSNVVVTGKVNTAAAAIYTITYKVTDSANNTASVSRSVVVRDNTIAPVITLLGDNPMQLNQEDKLIDPGATATDLEDGDITDDIKVTGAVDTAVADTYHVTYTVTDSDGNMTSVSRTVFVNAATESGGNESSSSTSSGGGSANRTLLLFLALLFLVRYRRKSNSV